MSPLTVPSPKPRKTATVRGKPRSSASLVLMVATRKGAWLFHSDAKRKTWRADGPHFLGHTISHLQLDPRDGRTLLAAARTGHLGPTVFRSLNFGRSWKEALQPPAFAQPAGGLPGRVVDHNFWLTPGHASEPDSWYVGTSPQGLFRSEDGGVRWVPLLAVNDDAQFREWMGSAQDGTPDGPKLHSVIVDPRDPAHLYFAMSGGGVHESHDGGRNWSTLIKGLEVVEGFDTSSVTFHDPHCVRLCPSNPDRLYQQNHCGIYRLDRLDGSGDTWQRLDKGLPESQAWWTVKRQAMTADAQTNPALYLGTTSGELWVGHDEGSRWVNIARHLPEIYAVEVAVVA